MKKCPNCGMTIDAHSECSVCGNNIVNEPQSNSEIEKYRLNKWFLIYLLKNHKIPLICTLIVLYALLAVIEFWGYWQILSLLLIVIMWLEALYKKFFYKIFNSVYTDLYIELTSKITMYACGIFAIVLAFL